MDFLKTLLAYMATTLVVAVESTSTPSVTPVPTPSPVVTAVEVAEEMEATPLLEETVTPAPTVSVTPAPVPTITPNTKAYHNLAQGDKGEEVKRLQERLIEMGYLPEGSADGAYGGQTRNAVRRFQYYNGLTVDGIAGRATQTNLFENPDAAPYPGEETATPEVTETPVPETAAPTAEPTEAPTAEPTEAPTAEPTTEPTEAPTAEPTAELTEAPTEEATSEAAEEKQESALAATETAKSTVIQTVTAAPTTEPTEAPIAEPTATPTEVPTAEPTAEPTEEPTVAPTEVPTAALTEQPTEAPTAEPTEAPTEAPTEVPEVIEEIDLDEAEQTLPPAPTAEPEPEAVYEDLAGWIVLNDSGESMQWTALEDGVPVVRSPRLQRFEEDIRVSLDDLCSAVESWQLTDEGDSLILEAQGFTLALLNEDAGFVSTVDGLEMVTENIDFEFAEGHFIRVDFLTRALDGSWEWDEEEETLMLRIPEKNPALYSD
ncbi:MAG: peptidoglycan-binding protein [Clostridia bacterium]|nr:peptidoglycan-binding protein [Clostridia bacterium]